MSAVTTVATQSFFVATWDYGSNLSSGPTRVWRRRMPSVRAPASLLLLPTLPHTIVYRRSSFPPPPPVCSTVDEAVETRGHRTLRFHSAFTVRIAGHSRTQALLLRRSKLEQQLVILYTALSAAPVIGVEPAVSVLQPRSHGSARSA